MKTVTYLRAYLLNSTSAKVELALKNDAKNIRLQGELIKKLEKVNNSNVRSDLEKAQKYTDQLTELRRDKYMFRALDAAERSEKSAASATETQGITKPALPPEMIGFMSSPKQVNITMNQLSGHLDAILACADRDAVNAQKGMRKVTTALQYLSDYNINDENKNSARGLLNQSVANENFCTFGDKNIDNDVQYDAVMAHLSTIKSWLDKNN
ncbi:hypothetical protein [Pseudescherichia sp.]|uniref:hypothetical protein n=1 Tax=Pseudescherichia sp. TaxID=2055881 RepID=UPI00289D71EE|nr:hypothetical protein [Pseudescherichia sp.]